MQHKRLVVVGGSAGIGLAVARLAAARGAHVTLVARDAARLAAAVAGFAPGTADTRVADAADARAFAGMLAGLPPIDHLYVAAGAFVGGGARELDLDAARRALDARVWGAVAAIRAARFRDGGSAVLTGGLSTDRPVAGAWATAIATAAAEQAARALAVELAPLRVNAISPGRTDTPMWDAVFGGDADAKRAAFDAAAARSLTGAVAHADHVAQAVLFLLENPAVTGEVLHVDGGQRLA